MSTRRWLAPTPAALAGWLAFSSAGYAADVEHIAVQRKGDRYGIHMQVRLDAPAQRAFEVFQHYENLPRINPSVTTVQRLDTAEHGDDVYTEVDLCVGFICRQIYEVQNMTWQVDAERHNLRATVDPSRSNLAYGTGSWTFVDCGEQQSCLDFRAEVEPDFWIPPVIEPWVIQRSMRREAIVTSEGIERLAQHPDAR